MNCAACGHQNPDGAKFCNECAARLTARPSKQPGLTGLQILSPIRLAEQSDAQEITDGERKTVTALFADIKGSMELMEELDPEEARAIVDPALKLMIETARRYDGYVVQSTGECRVGANTGEVVVRTITTGQKQGEYTPIGHTINLASRMQAVAPVGSIAVTDTTRRWCEGYFTFKSLGPTRLRGVQAPLEVHEVTGVGPLRTRLQRAVGRGLTVQAMLAARIDRLQTEEKELPQTLAVLGKEFTLSQIRATMADGEAELDRMLASLQSAEFIYEQPASGDMDTPSNTR